MAEIELSRGMKCVVDSEDFNALSQHNWYASTTSDGHTYAKRTVQKGDGRRTSVYLHKEVLGNTGKKKVDHINGNTLDNRKSNLRICSDSLNGFNRKNVCGVYYMRGKYHIGRKKKWTARIQFSGNHYFLGYFHTKEEALEVVRAKRIEIEKEFFHDHIFES